MTVVERRISRRRLKRLRTPGISLNQLRKDQKRREHKEREHEIRKKKFEVAAIGTTLALDFAGTVGLVILSSEMKVPPQAAMYAISQGLITLPGLSFALAETSSELNELKRFSF
jgi:hypothetical protein